MALIVSPVPQYAAFHATNTAGTTINTTPSFIPFATEQYDPLNMWVTDTFTAPYDGLWGLKVGIFTSAITLSTADAMLVYVINDGTEDGVITCNGTGGSINASVCYSNNYRLLAGKTLKIKVNVSAGSVALSTTAGRNFVTVSWLGPY